MERNEKQTKVTNINTSKLKIMQLQINTDFRVSITVSIIKTENGKVYFKYNLDDKKWNEFEGTSVKTIRVVDDNQTSKSWNNKTL